MPALNAIFLVDKFVDPSYLQAEGLKPGFDYLRKGIAVGFDGQKGQ